MAEFIQSSKHGTAHLGSAVVLRHVCKTYATDNGKLHALKDINLEVKAGEIFGIIGRSGAGKSTLVRCINMLEKPTSGQIIVGDWDMARLNMTALRRARRSVGMIFQHFNLLSSRTVFDNIALPLELEGMSRSQIRTRVLSLLDLVGLAEHAQKYVAQISGGQKQRVVVQRICDRVAVVDHGSIVEEGIVRDVFGFPKTQTTKALVGEATGQALPKETVMSLLAGAKPDMRVWQISGHQPDVLTQLVRRFHLDVALVQALVEDYQGIPLGTLLVQVEGSGSDREAAKQWATTVGVELEEINHVE